MKFQPKTEKEISEMNLLPEGEYAFDVIEAEEKNSKTTGAPMFVLTLKLYDQDLNPCGRVQDYLLEAMPHKLRHAAYGCDLGELYEHGQIDAKDFKGRNGVVKIKIEKHKEGKFADKNSVVDYVVSKEKVIQSPTPRTATGNFSNPTISDNDYIPF